MKKHFRRVTVSSCAFKAGLDPAPLRRTRSDSAANDFSLVAQLYDLLPYDQPPRATSRDPRFPNYTEVHSGDTPGAYLQPLSPPVPDNRGSERVGKERKKARKSRVALTRTRPRNGSISSPHLRIHTVRFCPGHSSQLSTT